MNFLSKSVNRLRQEAKALSKNQGISHAAALELVARSQGFANWKAILNVSDESRVAKQPTPPISTDFIKNEEISLNAEDLHIEERSADLPVDTKIRIAKNKEYFASVGVEFSIFEPTITGLKKSILDATRPVRAHFESEGFHYFDHQKQGDDHKIIKNAFFVDGDSIAPSKVSLYRPKTKQGDPRMWFSKLPSFAEPEDQVAIVVLDDELYLFNVSRILLENISLTSLAAQIIQRYLRVKNGIADELLLKLKEIAKKPIKSSIKGDTAVGMAVELALGLDANSSKKPDYKGIELKSGRGNKNRTTLFAQVADWGLSPCKSSAEILDKYGYERGADFKLYCTISTQNANSQGLKFYYDESTDQLIEKDKNGNTVAIWTGKLLRDRLLEKHSETFWIHATSVVTNGVEYFNLISVTHTKRPLESQLMPLIQAGVITMDHLIKRKGGVKPSVSEKGPLFKINKRDLSFLFPKPEIYELLD